MLNQIVSKFQYGQHLVTLETGVLARQSNAAVMVSMDDTSVFVTVVASKQSKPEQTFFPLTVNYQERAYAAGKFPKGFFRREGRPSDGEVLISRLLDRPIRPLFPKDFFHEVQVIATVVSVNPQINPDIVAMIGVSTALSLSDIPFIGPIGSARVGYINNEYILNPTQNELNKSRLDLIVAGTANSVLMVESEAQMLNEDQMLNAIVYGHNQQQVVIDNINNLVEKAGKTKWLWKPEKSNDDLEKTIVKLARSRIIDIYNIIEKKERCIALKNIHNEIIEHLINLDNTIHEKEIKNILNTIEKNIIRNRIIKGESRIDGRDKNMIRDINIRIGVLPRTHGSALFTRGETQALVTTTLGTERDAQNIDELTGEKIDRFLLHYNFPPYCVGEIGMMGAPKRREIGHGKLIKRGISAVMPSVNDFPYTVRVVSEITESNGSSSMASVCGASLALMDAGVPIKTAIAGIAMGLIKEKEKFVVLSDILSDEDALGDMDFKVVGNYEGITALQMDIKIQEITPEILKISLYQAKNARLYILEMMKKAISAPRNYISEYAPRIFTIKINPAKIKDVIGKGGVIIRGLTEETGATIDISDDGIIKIISNKKENIRKAVCRIEEITEDIKIGRIYNGKVTRIVEFGAFVTIGNGKEGLVHISQIAGKRIEKVTDYLKLGQEVSVKTLEVDRNNRIRFSIKDATNIK